MAVEFEAQLGKNGSIIIPSNIINKFQIEEEDLVKLVILFETDKVCKNAIIKLAAESCQ